jgi:spore coat protein CotH
MFRKVPLYDITPVFVVGLFVLLLLTGCTQSNLIEPVNIEPVIVAQASSVDETVEPTSTEPATTAADEETVRPQGWNEETHSNDVDPNFAVVFPQDKVNQLTITVDPETWQVMQANMTEIYGEPGTGPQGGAEFAPPEEQRPPGEPGFGGDFTREQPMWVTATIEFEGDTWTHVGIRYKGNSSLMSSWNSGSLKLPFKLDFDQFEDEYPEINNQRFYGFQQLSLANGFSDNTFMRDAVTYDLLEEAGLVAAETAFYEVYLDYGEGPVSLGLYTMIEVIDDTVIDRYFDDNNGNIYEGDGSAASLAEGTVEQLEDSFEKESNEGEADWSDIENLYNVLHSELRTTDPEAWRASLEEIFDVDSFLKWLAISAVIEHWDTYGAMTHNYYLYNNPETGQLTWISWDHNMTMSTGGFGRGGEIAQTAEAAPANNAAEAGNAAPEGNRGAGRGMQRNVSLDKAEVTDEWPLIRYLLDEPLYYEQYISYVEEAANELFVPEKMVEKVEQLAALLEPYASEDVGEEVFADAVQQLIDYVGTRSETVKAFLGES